MDYTKHSNELLKKEVLTEKEILLLVHRANRGIKINWDGFEGTRITPEQTEKGLAWLMNQWKTPSGKERKHNPYRLWEMEILKNFECFEFIGLYNGGNMYHDFYLPIYRVHSYSDCFEYIVKGGEISIIG